ncbi:MAG: hypothetical protein ACREPN_01480 [Rudaea sp.]
MNSSGMPQWTEQARRLLNASAQSLDAATLSRLNRARQVALAQRTARRRTWVFLPAGLAAACAMLLAVGVWQAQRSRSTAAPGPIATPNVVAQTVPTPSVAVTTANMANTAQSHPAAVSNNAQDATGSKPDDLELIGAADNLDMVQDLDFYAWLDTHSAKDNDG